jgi:hypothetical protein
MGAARVGLDVRECCIHAEGALAPQFAELDGCPEWDEDDKSNEPSFD